MMYISKDNYLTTLHEKMYFTVHVGHCSGMTFYTSIDVPDLVEVKRLKARVELGVRCIYDKNRQSSCLSAKKICWVELFHRICEKGHNFAMSAPSFNSFDGKLNAYFFV